jgi:3-phenylpropionate/trans-cinnamate dioxygenase ferredoxin reductase component
MPRYVIIGSGAAGIGATEAIRCHDPNSSITLICDEPSGYYSRPGLAYYLTGEVVERQLYPFSEQDFHRLNVQRLLARATRIHRVERQVELHNGAALAYDRLLIATGAKAASTKLPGIDADGVVKLDNMDDARRIVHMAKKGRTAVVVGGGITALEIVEGLVARGVKVHYFLRGDRYWSNVLDEIESRIVEHRLQEDGVQIHYHTELAEVLTKNNRVDAVITKDGRQIRCALVAVAIGVRPRKQLAETCGLETDRGILVNEYLQTSDPNIFAAGDVGQAYDPQTGNYVLDSLWGPAREQGTVAGYNMSGRFSIYQKLMPFNVTRLAHLTTTIIGMVGRGDDLDMIGIARGDSETFRQLPDSIAVQSDFSINRVRVLIDGNHIIGGIVMGDQTLSRPLLHLATHRVDITPIRDQLLRPGASIEDIISHFWVQTRERAHHAA